MADNTSTVREITAKLESGVKEVFTSEKYANYLATMSRFHKYSMRNIMLIYQQKPDASKVCGFRQWQDKFKRHVKKGEHAIKIFAPCPFVETKEFDKLDPVTKKPILDENGEPIKETLIRQGARFKVVNVFDASQTEGPPLPQLAETLTGDVRNYNLFVDTLKAVSSLPITFEPLNNADGKCYFGDKIVINTDMSEVQTVCAIIHEMAHAKLHDTNNIISEKDAPVKDNETLEIEAESVSYTVCKYYNIETSANSFGYLARWSSDKDVKILSASLDTIRKAASEFIESIDEKYLELAKERGIDLTIIPEIETSEYSEPIETVPVENAITEPVSEIKSEAEKYNRQFTEFEIWAKNLAETKYAKLPLQDKINVIAQTFGAKTGEIITRPCTGKWRGKSKKIC
ncbi:hypothetical protein FACS1894120_1040 [Clostridia bacterium]|nr:hypothetical protein FACS1894120_1040 [Clostridia bacterium]